MAPSKLARLARLTRLAPLRAAAAAHVPFNVAAVATLALAAFVAGCTAASAIARGPEESAATSDAGSEPSVDGGATSGNDGGSGASATDGSSASKGPSSSPTLATFATEDTGQYLTDGTGGALTADGANGGLAQTISLTDVNGGALSSGEAVYLAANGSYLSAADGGGGALTFSASTPGDDETFLLVRIAGAGLAAAGDQVALQTKVTSNYVSAINGGGGQVLANAPWDKAWETYTFGLAGATSTSDAGVASADDAGSPSAAARAKVIATLLSFTGKRVAIGVEDKDSSNPAADSSTMATMAGTGAQPSFWSADWGFGSDAVDNRETIVKEGEAQWAQGAIVQYIYHACPPSWGANEDCAWTDVDGSSLSASDWQDLITPGGTLNLVWLARLDVLATFFQELKDAGVAPLFRVLHEMNDDWVWWAGHAGQSGSAELYRITHDYLVNTKGLDNIVWVWNLKDISSLPQDVTSFAPGASYFDIAALDVYDQGYSGSNYTAMQQAAGGKPMGIAECETLPDPGTLAAQPLWSYIAMWPDYFSDDTTVIPELFNDPAVVTLGAMPGWK